MRFQLIASLPYDDAVERKALTQENFSFFARNVHKKITSRFSTARSVFWRLLTLAEPLFFTESVLIKFSSLQLLISAKLLAQKWGHRREASNDDCTALLCTSL